MVNKLIPNGYKNYIKTKIDEYIKQHHKIPQKNDMQDLSIEPLMFEYGNWRNVLLEFGYIKASTPESAFKELQDLQDELEGTPSLLEAKEAGIDTKALIQFYGNWRNVKKELKEKTTKVYKVKKTKEPIFNKKIKKDEEKLIAFTKQQKKIPTAKDAINQHVDMNKIIKKYGTWNNAKEQLQLYDIYESIVVEEVRELHIQNNKKPSLTMISNANIDIKPIVAKYGSWTNACKHLNITTFDKEKTKDMIRKELEKQRKLPSLADLKEQGFDEKPLLKVYKTWNHALKDFGLDLEEEKILAEDIQTLCNQLGYVPTVEEMKERHMNISAIFKKYHGFENFREKYDIKVVHVNYEINTDELEKKLKLVEKIIGKMPEISDAEEFDINVEELLKKYGNWQNVVSNLKN